MYRKHQLNPEEILNFVELRIFRNAWEKDLSLSEETDLFSLEITLMAEPRGGDVVRGSKGLRKIRCTPDSWPAGKSSSIRVLYVYFEEHAVILLVYAYRKNDRSDISKDELKRINQAICRIKDRLDAGLQIN